MNRSLTIHLPLNLDTYDSYCMHCFKRVKKGTCKPGVVGKIESSFTIRCKDYFCDWDCSFTGSSDIFKEKAMCLYLVRRRLDPLSKMAEKTRDRSELKIFGGNKTHAEWKAKIIKKTTHISQTWEEHQLKLMQSNFDKLGIVIKKI